MENAIEVIGLCKEYEKFSLSNVSFSVPKGSITGFIGRNGAGKTTSLKSMLNIVHSSSGSVFINGFDLAKNEEEIKSSIGFSISRNFYPNTKIKTLTKVIKAFYSDWNEETYKKLISQFEIDESKKHRELSSGMQVKYAIACALSHGAKTLILDEPTSGLDPASRDEIILLFEDFVSDGEGSILFSTHITSDLEKCADHIVYIKEGQIFYSGTKENLLKSWALVKGDASLTTKEMEEKLYGFKIHKGEFEALAEKSFAESLNAFTVKEASLEDIIVHLERKS